MIEIIKDLAIVVGVPIIRSVSGWLHHSLEDGKICTFELKKLADTVLRLGISGILIYFGASGIGLDVDVITASASAFVLDLLISAMKSKKE